MATYFACEIQSARFSNVRQSNFKPGSITICSVELDSPIGATLNRLELENLKTIFASGSIVIWLSAAALFRASNPESAIIPGLARAVMVEHPSLKFCHIDVAPADKEIQALNSNICWVIPQLRTDHMAELEYLQHEGVLHISRFAPERSLNRRFHAISDRQSLNSTMLDTNSCTLSIKHLGQLETLHFVELEDPLPILEPDWVVVKVLAISLNAKVRPRSMK